MRQRPSDDGGRRGGVSSDEKLSGFFGGLLRRYPWLPKAILFILAGLVLAGLALSFL